MLLFILLIDVRAAYAAGVFNPNASTITLPATIDIPNTTSVGQILWTSNRIHTLLTDSATSTSRFSTGVIGGNLSTYGNNVFETGVKGVGFRIVGEFRTPLTSLKMYFGELSDAFQWPGNSQSYRQEAYLELVSTSDTIESGSIDLSNILATLSFNLNNQGAINQRWQINITGKPVVKRVCFINNIPISVPMGSINKQSFNGLGTWPGDANTKNFSISLNCNTGARINLQINGDVQNAEQGIINISERNSSASGIGIQLLFNNNPVKLSDKISIGQVTNNTNYNIPLQARYYQIKDTITPGTVNAIASFTLTYD